MLKGIGVGVDQGWGGWMDGAQMALGKGYDSGAG